MTTSRDARADEKKAETMAESHDASRTERERANQIAKPRLTGDQGEGVVSAAIAVCVIRPPSAWVLDPLSPENVDLVLLVRE